MRTLQTARSHLRRTRREIQGTRVDRDCQDGRHHQRARTYQDPELPHHQAVQKGRQPGMYFLHAFVRAT